MNNIEFADYAKSKIGCYYWYGTFGQIASKTLYEQKKKQYPNYYTASDFNYQIANPKQCFDCAGLVKSIILLKKYNASDDLGATGIYGKCKVKGKLTDILSIKVGSLLFKGNDTQKSHVGIYVGNNTIVEAKGHNYGVISSSYNSTWKYYAEYYAVDYNEQPTPQYDIKFDSDICKYCQGITLTVNTITDPLMLRSTPEIRENNIIASMPKGSKVIWKGYYNGEWYKVYYNGLSGFAYKSYLKR